MKGVKEADGEVAMQSQVKWKGIQTYYSILGREIETERYDQNLDGLRQSQ